MEESLLSREQPFVEARSHRPHPVPRSRRCSRESSPSLRRGDAQGRHQDGRRSLLSREQPFVEARTTTCPTRRSSPRRCSRESSPSLRPHDLGRITRDPAVAALARAALRWGPHDEMVREGFPGSLLSRERPFVEARPRPSPSSTASSLLSREQPFVEASSCSGRHGPPPPVAALARAALR